ncbi:MAG TPA: bifunctional acetate--CoA ligase family protein/GNAT family N-acetyltransferase [Burkholderiaceae bacterium]|nr:bifunctional acetate--CoA ligase family protein/GNAT family N-acetyltransferase [Burkholderiaceae bacterium]
MDKHYLQPLLEPEAIVVFTARAGDAKQQTAQGRALTEAIRAQRFTGTIRFLEIGTTGTLAELSQTRADLAIIALPPRDVAAALEVAGRITCKAALVVSSGIGAAQAAELRRIAHREGVLLLGPNSLGFQRPKLNLNASAAGPLARAGSLGLVCQSGALTAAMLDWARSNGVGFSLVASVGPHTDVDIAQVLDFLASDPQTQSILVYLEGIGSARRFMSALRSAAIAKPVVVLKAGRRLAGNEAAQTHSAATVGSDEVFDAALRRAGAVRVRSFVELFSAAKCLASRYRPVGARLAIVTNGGGPGVLAADWVNEIGLKLGRLSPMTIAGLKPLLPDVASVSDLIDVSEDATPEHYVAAIRAAAADKDVDGLLAIHSPKAGVDPVAVAKAVAGLLSTTYKPLLSCWMGDASMAGARVLLNDAGIASFRTPEAAVGAFGNIATFYENQRLLQQTPPPLSTLAQPDIEGARLLIESVVAERRKVLTEMESKTLLSSFHVPVTQTILARSPTEAMMIATQLGFPVALKIDSPDIVHKSDVQGVALNLMSGTSVRETYADMMDRVARLAPHARINGVTVQKMARARRGREVSVGVVTDDPFGPVIVFGAGGVMIELIADRAMELPPLNQFLARRLIERARVSETLAEWRGAAAVDVSALEQVLLRVSEMVCALPQLREMDINPLIVDEHGAVAVDARIVVDGGPQAGLGAPGQFAHLAILPYPSRFEQQLTLRGGGTCLLRPIRPDDAQMLQDLVRGLSPESRYFRFVSSFNELPATMLSRFTLIDYDREMALVAVVRDRTSGEDGAFTEIDRIVGVSRYVITPDQHSCEFSLVVAEDMKGRGLGSRLMESIMEAARERGLAEIVGLVLRSNAPMLKLMQGMGFEVKRFDEDPDFVKVTHAL